MDVKMAALGPIHKAAASQLYYLYHQVRENELSVFDKFANLYVNKALSPFCWNCDQLMYAVYLHFTPKSDQCQISPAASQDI